MNKFKYVETFEEIFWTVYNELGLSGGWWKLFDSEKFEAVKKRIAKAFGKSDATEVPFFLEWNNQMAEDL